ncbi:uncharacterized protein PV09_07941 [Verruconis gallopava]|uniref:54S ribosomal protein L31, mitochondrial n=1 Tax=Verruconis gallopava TaxID=253628 RepID=A0A0D2A1L2_9PEZI|nr:uncharacterized protein PV09_07941 [Verruconis gallopava]KIW00588.1 hypothetical protein PV09_07941 [Verruconis gallopava]
MCKVWIVPMAYDNKVEGHFSKFPTATEVILSRKVCHLLVFSSLCCHHRRFEVRGGCALPRDGPKRKCQACGLSHPHFRTHFWRQASRSFLPAKTMFGPFKATSKLLGGLLWKIPWRLSSPRKYRHRLRLKRVDKIVSILDSALSKQGLKLKAVERWKAEMPAEHEIMPKDKYTVFDRKQRGYRKGIHKVPKWTRISQRINPPGY